MEKLLVVTLILVLIALTATVIPLLQQLRKTAMAVERLADSAAKDLDQMTADIHAAKLQVDGLVEHFKPSGASAAGGSAAGFLQGAISGRFAPVLSGLVGLLSLFISRKK